MFYLKWKRELGKPSLFWDLRTWVLNLSEAWPFPDLARAIDQWCEHGFAQIALVDAAGDEFYYRDRIDIDDEHLMEKAFLAYKQHLSRPSTGAGCLGATTCHETGCPECGARGEKTPSILYKTLVEYRCPVHGRYVRRMEEE